MSLTILPYRIQTARHRPFMSPISSSLEITPGTILHRPSSANVQQRLFRQPTVLASPSFLAENLQFYRLPSRSRSTNK